MDPSIKRSPAEWFESAENWHLEGHQGCVNCGSRHCVFRTQTETMIEFYCFACDFSLCKHLVTGRHYVWGDGKINPPRSTVLDQVLQEADC